MPVDLMDVAAPGEAVPTLDVTPHDPLVQLGLVDPRSGLALPAEDWQPAEPAQPAQPQAPDGGVAPTPAGQTAQTGQLPVDRSAGSTLEMRLQTLQSQAAAAYAQAVGGGADPRQAEAVIGAELRAQQALAREQAVRQASMPSVKSAVASHISQTLGNGVVKPEDLMHYDSPQAMEHAARQLASARRQSNYDARRTSGVDRAEGTSPAAGLAPAIAGLSPEKKIELGIRRGQFS